MELLVESDVITSRSLTHVAPATGHRDVNIL